MADQDFVAGSILPSNLKELSLYVRGFMPVAEGEALGSFALEALRTRPSFSIEIGSYCGLSTIYLGWAAAVTGTTLVSVDHHIGSVENGPGWEHHDQLLYDPIGHSIDTLYRFRRTLAVSGLKDHIVAVVSDSVVASRVLSNGAAFVFIDGGHGREVAFADYWSYAPKLAHDGMLAIHDVFEDPAQGGRPPYEIYDVAISSGSFVELAKEGSLRILKRTNSELNFSAL